MATSLNCRETNWNRSISFAADFHVKTFRKPESEPESRALARAFGLSSPVLLGFFDPDSFSLKTSQACLITGQCQELSENWPDSGMWDLGSAYELQSSGLPISENEFSLWPTAAGSIANDGETPEAWEFRRQRNIEKHYNGNGMGTPLTWPTPRSEDGESCGNHPNSRGDSLTGIANTWPTPEAHFNPRGPGFSARDCHYKPHDLAAAADLWRTPDSPGSGVPRNRQDSVNQGHQPTIAEQAEHWKTPHGMSNPDHKGKVGGCGGGEFAKQANHWQTPATDSFRSRGGDRVDEMGLDQQARMFPLMAHSLPAQLIPDGQPSSEKDPISHPPLKRRLNPRFVEWLMGFPAGWTEL